MRHRTVVVPTLLCLLVCGVASAQNVTEEAAPPVASAPTTPPNATPAGSTAPSADATDRTGLTLDAEPLVLMPAVPAPLLAAQAPAPVRPVAFEYSDAYHTRAKIHKLASWAMVPLFVGTYVAGEKLYDFEGGESTRSVHSALATSTGVLFGANTVTGVWNLWEGRKDPNGRGKRLLHSIMMLGADAGFVATGMLAPDDEEGGGNRSTHRTVALTSMGVATASWLIMLFSR